MAHGGNRILKQTNLPNDMDILICKGEIFELLTFLTCQMLAIALTLCHSGESVIILIKHSLSL